MNLSILSKKSLVAAYMLSLSLSSYSYAMEMNEATINNDQAGPSQRWRADFTTLERAKDLPWFPFNVVIEEGSRIQGLDRHASVRKAAKHLLRYASTTHTPEKEAGFILGYFKITAKHTDILLSRRLYATAVCPSLELYSHIETLFAQILSADIQQKFKSHAAIWFARIIMKISSHLDDQDLTQTYLQSAQQLLKEAHDHNATDTALLWIAELYLRYNLRLDNDITISETQALELAANALDRVGIRGQESQRLRSRLNRQRRTLQHALEPLPVVSDEPEPLVSKAPYMSRKEQQQLYVDLLEDLSDQRDRLHATQIRDSQTMNVVPPSSNTDERALPKEANTFMGEVSIFSEPSLINEQEGEEGSEAENEEEQPAFTIIPIRGPNTLFSRINYTLKPVSAYPGLEEITHNFNDEISTINLGEPMDIYSDFPGLIAQTLDLTAIKLTLFTGNNHYSFNHVYAFPYDMAATSEFRLHHFKNTQGGGEWWVVIPPHPEEAEMPEQSAEGQKHLSRKRPHAELEDLDSSMDEADQSASKRLYSRFLTDEDKEQIKRNLERHIQKHPIRTDLSINQLSSFITKEVKRQADRYSRTTIKKYTQKFLKELTDQAPAPQRRKRIDQSTKEKILNDFLNFKETSENQINSKKLFSAFYKTYGENYGVSNGSVRAILKKAGHLTSEGAKPTRDHSDLRKEVNKAIRKWFDTKVGQDKPTTNELREWLKENFPQLSSSQINNLVSLRIKSGSLVVPKERVRSNHLSLEVKLNIIRDYKNFITKTLKGGNTFSLGQKALRKKHLEHLAKKYNCSAEIVKRWVLRIGSYEQPEPSHERKQLFSALMAAKKELLARYKGEDVAKERMAKDLESFPNLQEFCRNNKDIKGRLGYLNAVEVYFSCVKNGIFSE
ncbi:hypothetical protein [Candidatus Odyssella thessalonicensis]|uniref:hypothetical protein n=1 Tax=Candidatus Odyssella thessalonicensis TaxID=84647 RepID=UPI000225AC02|nr:hypothetical protein [Candidatus Odyssella thessalonicensis]